MIIIGHRGAGGIEPENTIASIEAAIAVGVDKVEIDIQVTADNKLVVFHDTNILRLAGQNKKISEMTFKDISTTVMHSGHPVPGFLEAIEAAGKTPVLLDCKGKGWAKLVHENLKGFKGPRPTITAKDVSEISIIKELIPGIETFISESTNPFEGIYKAKLLGFTGISLNFWVMNPLAYHFAMRNKLKFMIYTIDHVFIARFLHFLYPNAYIITNRPNRLAKLSRKSNGKNK